MKDTQREAETQAEGEAGSPQEARCGTRFWDSGIMPWAKGRCSVTEPPTRPSIFFKDFILSNLYTQCGPQTHDPGIKSCRLLWAS